MPNRAAVRASASLRAVTSSRSVSIVNPAPAIARCSAAASSPLE